MTMNDIVESDLEVYLTNYSSNSLVSYLALIFNKMLYSSPIEPQIWGLNYPKECNIIKSRLTHYKYIIYTHYS